MVLQVPARLQVCPHGLVVHMTEKMKFFELITFIKEIYHISDIREVGLYCCLVDQDKITSLNFAHSFSVLAACSRVNYIRDP